MITKALCMLLLACCCQAALYGIWDDFFSGNPLQFYTIDEKTGNQTKLIYTNEDWLTLFGYPITADHKNQIVYFPLMNGADVQNLRSHVVGFDMSNPQNVQQTIAVAVPMEATMVLYDSSTNLIYVGGFIFTNLVNMTITPFTIGVVDPVQQTYKQLLQFPKLEYPYIFPTPGSCATIDEKNQILVLGMMQNLDDGSNFRLISIDLTTLKMTIVNQTTYYAQALTWNPEDGNVYGLVSLITTASLPQFNTSWAMIDVNALSINVISTWQNEFLIFVIEGIITTDFTNNVGYSIIGDGTGPPVAFTSWDTKTGELIGYSEYADQPQFIISV